MPIAPLAMATQPVELYGAPDVAGEACAVIVGLPSPEYGESNDSAACGPLARPPNAPHERRRHSR